MIVVTVNFAQAMNNVSETQGMVELCVSLTGQLQREIEVSPSTTGQGTATADADYQTISSRILTFGPIGPALMCLNVTVIRDFILEAEENFFVSLSAIEPAVLSVVPPSTAEVVITDSDRKSK